MANMDDRPAIPSDRYLWLKDQARLLKEQPIGHIDSARVAAELEQVAHDIEFQLRVLVYRILCIQVKQHLVPDAIPDPHWAEEAEQRKRELGRIIDKSPSLAMRKRRFVAEEWQQARVTVELALHGLGYFKVLVPERCPVAVDDIFVQASLPVLRCHAHRTGG